MKSFIKDNSLKNSRKVIIKKENNGCYRSIIKEKISYNVGNLAYLLIPLVAFIIYYPSFSHGFIQDDFANIFRASHQFNAYNVFINGFFTVGFYRPITNEFGFFISHLIFGIDLLGYRMIIFGLFTLNGILVFSIIRTLLDRTGPALMAALIYVTSGTLFMSVYWISAGFNEEGTAFFMLSSLYLYLLYLKKGNRLFYISSIAVSVMALMSKDRSSYCPCSYSS